MVSSAPVFFGSITYPVQNFNFLLNRGWGKVCEVCFGSNSLLNFGILRVKWEGKKKDTEELKVFSPLDYIDTQNVRYNLMLLFSFAVHSAPPSPKMFCAGEWKRRGINVQRVI